ncbi:hypothetical protein [Bartonella koehlerae]|uniref:hypothetical protein n=1 Tax=Bartonella koehlerae TaxID=92181 RepID=UPI00054D9599|nr:hypothetical protein [Bartonella koehlerae]
MIHPTASSKGGWKPKVIAPSTSERVALKLLQRARRFRFQTIGFILGQLDKKLFLLSYYTLKHCRLGQEYKVCKTLHVRCFVVGSIDEEY